MKIVAVKPMDDCFDGSFMKLALFDEPVDEAFILHLGTMGELQYYSDFARPFFRLDIPNVLILKGIQGEKRIRLILDRSDTEAALRHFVAIVERFDAITGSSVPRQSLPIPK